MPCTNAEITDTLFRHISRPDWGLAIFAWQHDDKRGFQFEDGQLRIFKAGYFDRLQPVDRPAGEHAHVRAELDRAIGRRRAAKRIGADHPAISLADQIAYFSALYPKRFQGVKWAKERRGIDARTQLKRHRAPMIRAAAELLTPQRLRAHLDGGLATIIVERLCSLADATDLVTAAAVRGLERAEGVAAEALVRALADLLADDGDVVAMFDAWVAALTRALDRKPTWELATAVPALARPDRFTAVRRNTFLRQAAWMAPTLVIDEVPTGAVYRRLLEMTATIAAKLGEAGLRPRDRLDIYDFIQVTLRPKAVREITAAAELARDQASETRSSNAA